MSLCFRFVVVVKIFPKVGGGQNKTDLMMGVHHTAGGYGGAVSNLSMKVMYLYIFFRINFTRHNNRELNSFSDFQVMFAVFIDCQRNQALL